MNFLDIPHSYFNTFDKNSKLKIDKNYIISNGKKIMQLLNLPKKNIYKLDIKNLKKNNLVNTKIILKLDTTKINSNKEELQYYLKKYNEHEINFKHINLLKYSKLKYLKSYLKSIEYLDKRYIQYNNQIIDIYNLNNNIKVKSPFKFVIFSGSLRINLNELKVSNKILVLLPKNLTQLGLLYFDKLSHTIEDIKDQDIDTILFLNYLYEKPIDIPKNIKNIIVYHSRILDKNTIEKYVSMFFPFINLSEPTNLLSQLYCLTNLKKSKRNRIHLFNLTFNEKKIIKNMSNRKNRLNFSSLIETIFPNYKSITNNFYCSICLTDIEKSKRAITKCEHIFCRKCILSAIKYSNNCPNCRRNLNYYDIYSESKKLNYIIKNCNKKSLIISNNQNSIKYLRQRLKLPHVIHVDNIYNMNLNTFNKLFLLEKNDYLTDYLLALLPQCKIHVLLNKK